MTSLLRRPAIRWVVPLVAAAAFISAGSVVSALTNAAQADLAPRSAARLLVDIQQARLAGLSGTVVQNSDLGFPALPANLPGGDASLASLVSGSHTLRVWYAGPAQVRLSLLGQLGESDLVRNGRDLWSWSSADRSAQHWVLPDHAGPTASTNTPDTPEQVLTPQQAADAALAAISPTTSVTTNGTAIVAGRRAYLLTLQPKSASTLIDSVQIAIDGRTHVPTRVQVFAKGMTAPAFSVGFASFNPSKPSTSVFGFNPPPGTKVTERSLPQHGDLGADQHGSPTGPAGPGSTGTAPKVVGSGWSAVLVASVPPTATSNRGPLGALVSRLPKVSGSWGSGRLLEGTAFSALLTDDGRLVVGAVPPSGLYAALAR